MNPLQPQTATVTEVVQECPGTCTLVLELPGPGLVEAFRPGQFNMLGLAGFGEVPVAFSAVDSPTVARHTVRVAGRVTRALTRLRAGDEVQIRGPYGTAWPVEALEGRDLVLLAGGMGVIPVAPLMEALLERRDDYGDILVLYGAREPEQMLFVDTVQRWGEAPGVQVRLTVDAVPEGTRWEHAVGVVTHLLDHPSRGAPADVGIIAGPELMMRFSVQELRVRGMYPGRLYVSLERHMKCGIGHCGHCQLGPHSLCQDGPVLPYSAVRRLPDTLFGES
jgi:NAD(P)H-flavin reductase